MLGPSKNASLDIESCIERFFLDIKSWKELRVFQERHPILGSYDVAVAHALALLKQHRSTAVGCAVGARKRTCAFWMIYRQPRRRLDMHAIKVQGLLSPLRSATLET